MTLPIGMTAEKLREIADLFDTYDGLAEEYIGALDGLKWWSTIDDTYNVLADVRGREVQIDLRRWADEIEQPRRQAPSIPTESRGY